MAKKEETQNVSEPVETNTYYRIIKAERNLYTVETITVTGNVVESRETTEPNFFPIAFDKLRRRAAVILMEAPKNASN